MGRSGGLEMMLKKVNFEVIFFSRSIIDGFIHSSSTSFLNWYTYGVYGHLEIERRIDFLNALRSLK